MRALIVERGTEALTPTLSGKREREAGAVSLGEKTNHGARLGLSDAELQFIDVGADSESRRIAFRARAAQDERAKPGLVWLTGLKSDMSSTKALALDDYCAKVGRALLRFDYSGHGASGGRFEGATITRWLEETLAVIRAAADGPRILVGSSMGGYLALLAARALAQAGEAKRLAGMALIAPAVDFTEALIWANAPAEARRAILEDGAWARPSLYSADPYPITRALIEDGRRHLLLGGTIRTYGPTHILQGMRDEDVPYRHALTLVEHIAGDPVTLTLVKDGDHRLSRPQDIALLLSAIEALA
jgi:pimeloyl-ACP methyl ester carboxylesterase